jgi:hypothetical protein
MQPLAAAAAAVICVLSAGGVAGWMINQDPEQDPSPAAPHVADPRESAAPASPTNPDPTALEQHGRTAGSGPGSDPRGRAGGGARRWNGSRPGQGGPRSGREASQVDDRDLLRSARPANAAAAEPGADQRYLVRRRSRSLARSVGELEADAHGSARARTPGRGAGAGDTSHPSVSTTAEPTAPMLARSGEPGTVSGRSRGARTRTVTLEALASTATV